MQISAGQIGQGAQEDNIQLAVLRHGLLYNELSSLGVLIVCLALYLSLCPTEDGGLVIHQLHELFALVHTLLHRVLGAAGAELGADNAPDVELWGQAGVDNAELVVRLVLSVGVDNQANPPAGLYVVLIHSIFSSYNKICR